MSNSSKINNYEPLRIWFEKFSIFSTICGMKIASSEKSSGMNILNFKKSYRADTPESTSKKKIKQNLLKVPIVYRLA